MENSSLKDRLGEWFSDLFVEIYLLGRGTQYNHSEYILFLLSLIFRLLSRVVIRKGG